MSNHDTDEVLFSPGQPAGAEEQPLPGVTRLFDIHVYDIPSEEEEQASIESTITNPDEEPTHNEERASFFLRRNTVLSVSIGMLVLLALGTLITLSISPMLFPEATVTIVPVSKQVRMTTTITLTGATGRVPGRTLSSVTMSQEQSAPTTGKAHQDAQAAQGLVTFYNNAPYAQTIVAGTLLTGADGVQVVTDQSIPVPAAAYPTLGQASVTAHTTSTGPASNIKAGDIYGLCCLQGISAVNSAFTGGQDARDYQTATQTDIDTVARSLTKSLNQSEQAAMQTQVRANETLITPLPCQETVTPDHRPGEEAAQVQVTVSETCTGIVYTTQAYQDDMTQALNQQATTQLGAGYSLIGQPQNTIVHVNTQDRQHITLQVSVAGTYDYQLSQEQLQQMKTLVAGKSKAQATAAVLRVPGVQSVSISSNQGTLPSNSAHIQVVQILMG